MKKKTNRLHINVFQFLLKRSPAITATELYIEENQE